jgi:predicted RNA-binding protein associated with RNAse of E/G family
MRAPDGTTVAGPDADRTTLSTWYVDLVTVSTSSNVITVRDLYADVMVPEDGRHQRILDLDELADAVEDGTLELATALDGLRRWQRFFDLHLHHDRDPRDRWTDFPPRRLHALSTAPAPLDPIATAPE